MHMAYKMPYPRTRLYRIAEEFCGELNFGEIRQYFYNGDLGPNHQI